MRTPHSLLPYVPEKLPAAISVRPSALARAKRAIQEYESLLSQAEDPDALCTLLVLKEVIATTQLSTYSLSFAGYLTSSSCSKGTQAIEHTLEAFYAATDAIRRRPFSKSLLCSIHRRIKRGTATAKSALGHYRSEQNWIGPAGCSLEEAYYLPPTPHYVFRSMKQLVDYINTTTKEPLLQLAQVVAQILIIHPFMDGNGRVARMSIPLFLFRSRVLSHPFFFLSRYIQKHRLSYLSSLYDITDESNWQNWTHFFLNALTTQAKEDKKELERLLQLWKKIDEQFSSKFSLTTRKKLLRFLFSHLTFTRFDFQKEFKREEWLDWLQDHEVVKKRGKKFWSRPAWSGDRNQKRV